MQALMILSAAVLAVAPLAVSAGGMGNALDLYYISAGVEVDDPFFGSGDDDGDGFGIKGNFAIADSFFLSGEYQAVGYDDSDLDLDQFRGGIGVNSDPLAPAVWYGLAEFLNFKLDDGTDSESESGFGLHVGGRFAINEVFGINGRIGYVDIDDADGLEWLIGGDIAFTEQLGAFADYRVTSLEDDTGVESDFDDLRVGVRWRF